MDRRNFLKMSAATSFGAMTAPAIVRAQAAPIRLGILTPLTGAGGVDGPRMIKAMRAVADEVNARGGVLARKIDLIVEDDQTNPEAAVRAAQKLVGVDKVPIIMGTWASAVTSAVAPVCWESKTCLMTVSGADSITQLPHLGYVIRTQPTSTLQATKHAEYIVASGAKRVSYMAVQTPFAVLMREKMREVLAANGVTMVGGLVYDANKNSYRSEVDQALRDKPDMVYLNSYTPDITVLLRDLYRSNYSGAKLTHSYAFTTALAESLPAEVSNGLFIVQPSGEVNSEAYAHASKRLGVAQPDSYDTQATDWISLAILAIAKAGEAKGEAIRDAIRKISQGDGKKIYSASEGLAALAKGESINYEGASGPCDFDERGDILDCRFRYSVAEGGKIKFLKIV